MVSRKRYKLGNDPIEDVKVAIDDFYNELAETKKVWLVTGCAGFIGTNLVKKLISLNQKVVGLDNFSTGLKSNIEFLNQLASTNPNSSFEFYEGDIRALEDCQKAMSDVDFVLHQAALGSVPRSIKNPLASHESNVSGFLNVLWAAKESGIQRVVYASSSSIYGDNPNLPKVEHSIGKPLSPYAATKFMNEVYADVFAKTYGLETIGLRYFNVFGPHQQPNGPYAAVIPKWIGLMLEQKPITIFGDGETSRDFCFIDNVVQMNLKCATTKNKNAANQEYNVAYHQQTSLNQLFYMIKEMLMELEPNINFHEPQYEDFRAGDVRHSLADINKGSQLIGYEPTDDIESGLRKSIKWYIENHKSMGN
ncbi:MAG: SDR family oxidoreductase [Bdellovibrionales bacterium]|nr:SDR family oxidoreductase [Bdellovibrionales bacterium]